MSFESAAARSAAITPVEIRLSVEALGTHQSASG
jgi:hypothetical protein